MIKFLGVDTMGLSKDLLDNPASEAHINNHIDSVVRDFPNLTHIGISVPMNTNAEAIAARGSAFAIEPATYMARFMDRIHFHGKKVLFRGTNCYYEAIYNFPSQNFRNGNRFNYLALPITDDFTAAVVRSHGYGLTSAANNITSNYVYATGDAGNVWSMSGGELVGPSGNGWRRAIFFNASNVRDMTMVAKVKKVGNQQIIVRGSTDPNFPGYGLQLRSTNTVRIERPGLENLGQVSKTLVEGQWYWAKLQAIGTAIKAKVWDVDDTTYPNSTDGSENEPGTWDIEITNSTYTSGLCGFSGESSNGHFDKMTILPVKETGTWIQRTCDFWINNINLLRSGDNLACFPEAAFASFSNGGTLSQFFIDLQYCLDQICAENDLVLNNGFASHLFTTVIQGSMSATVFQNAGMVSFDHYGTALGLNKRFGSFFHGNAGYANTYTPPSSISEAATDKHNFIPEKVAYNTEMDVFVVTKGTGDLKLTLHKSNNSPVQMPDPQTMVYSNSYEYTIPNASIVEGALNTFPIPWDNPDTDTTYHAHITQTGSGATIKTNVAGDFNTAYFNGYKANASPEALEIDLRKTFAKYGGLPLYLQEWGDFWSKDASRSSPVRTQAEHEAYLDSIYAMKKRLIDDGVLGGYQYWRTLGGLEGINSDVDPTSGFDYQLNYKGLRLKAFFDQLTVEGQEGYSRENVAALPENANVLSTVYTTDDLTDVENDDDVFVANEASQAGYNVHMFKKLYTLDKDAITATIKLKSTRAGSSATIYLQIFNVSTEEWETLDSDNSTPANTEFTLTGVQSTNLQNYYDTGNVVSFRVYQQIA